MAQLVRLLRQWPMVQSHCCSSIKFYHLLSSSSLPLGSGNNFHALSFSNGLSASSRRDVHCRSRGPKLSNSSMASNLQVDETSDSDSDSKKSRNQLKRDARRAVRWGMELASLSTPQIKRILIAVSLEEDVLEAIMLVKRLGPDVREGKRRQFNYIGKLLRDVEPELMDALIQATKEGDLWKLQTLAGSRTMVGEDGDENPEESDYLEEEEGSQIEMVNRWLDGLIRKDISISNELYSMRSVEFDRQELRKLVRKVHSIQERGDVNKENEANVEVAMTGAKGSLTRFLHAIAKQMPDD